MAERIHHRAPTDEELLARFRAAELKATPQRLAIYRALAGTDTHPSPEILFKSVQPTMPTLSQATVYKTLDALERAGLVSQVALPNQSKRYDANIDPHHHLVCTHCRRVIDFQDAQLDTLPLPSTSGFVAEQLTVQVLGICESCAPSIEAGPTEE